ncbi:hypothetical protein DPMN_083089 [Dreissena polymorpha]|uniref:Uncharacterized protein n=1 Tax=Dreissena polymorpha TaxID=45954 RepID=A0A9D4BAS2_DREPO|nr:hypothetical protein DPMN_083089 [Dreissena polymorpha]
MCFRTVKEAHGQPWDKNDSRTLDGSYTDHHGSSRILPSSRIAVLASRSPKGIAGLSIIDTAATRFTWRIVPDIIRVDPASILYC